MHTRIAGVRLFEGETFDWAVTLRSKGPLRRFASDDADTPSL